MTHPDASPAPPRSRAPFIATVLLGAIAVLYGAAWFGTALVLRAQTARFIDAQRQAGATITTAALRIAGFPARVRVVVPDMAVSAPVEGGTWSWQTDEIAVRAWPLDWHRIWIDLGGRHRIVGALGPDVPLSISARDAVLDVALDTDGRVRHATGTATDAVVTLTEGGDPWLRIGSGRAEAVLTDVPTPQPSAAPEAHPASLPVTARLVLEARDVAPPKLLPATMTAPIARAALTAEITGRVPSGPLPDVLEAWRGSGGTLEIRDGVLDWPPVHIATSGTVALDGTLQPMGSLSVRIEGGGEVLALLAQNGAISSGAAGIGQTALALMSRKNASGAPELSLPLTLQDRRLSAGPFALGRLQAIGWPRLKVP